MSGRVTKGNGQATSAFRQLTRADLGTFDREATELVLEAMRAEADEHKRTLKQQVTQETQAERKQLEDDRAALENLREGLALRQEELQRRHNEQRQKQNELEASRAAIAERTREVEASLAAPVGDELSRRAYRPRIGCSRAW